MASETSGEQRGRISSFSQKLESGLRQLKQRAVLDMESVRTRLAPIKLKGVKMARASREMSLLTKVELGITAIGVLTAATEAVHAIPYAVGWEDPKDYHPLVVPAVLEMFESMIPLVSSVEDGQVPVPTLVQVTPEGTPLFVGVFPSGTAVVEATGEVITVTPAATFALTETAAATATEALPAWQVLTEGGNLLAGGQWGRVEGVTVLPDGSLEIRGSGGQDGWNTPINSGVKLTEIKGEFAIKTSLKANPDSSYAGIVLVEGQRANGEWWRTKRLDVSIRNGGEGVWIGYWDGTKQSAETIAELTGWNLDPETPHDVELRFSVEANQVWVWVDGKRVGNGSLGQLLDQRQLRIGFNADPEAVLTVSQVAVEVPEGGDGNLVITGLAGDIQPTPRATAIPATAIPKPSPTFILEPSPTATAQPEVIGPPPFGEAPRTIEQLQASIIEVGESPFYENRVIKDTNFNVVEEVDVQGERIKLKGGDWIELAGGKTAISQCRSLTECDPAENDQNVFYNIFTVKQLLSILRPGIDYASAIGVGTDHPPVLGVDTVASP